MATGTLARPACLFFFLSLAIVASWADASEASKQRRPVLVFTTPWNPTGEYHVLQHARNITVVSPVGLEIVQSSAARTSAHQPPLELRGTDTINEDVYARWRRANPKLKIAPRVVLQTLDPTHVLPILRELVKRYSLQGFVLEFGYADFNNYMPALVDFLVTIKKQLPKLSLYLVVGAPRPESGHSYLNADNAGRLLSTKLLSGICVMSYDFTADGPQAPLPWVTSIVSFYGPEVVNSKKLFMGVAFYGRDNGEPLLGRDWHRILLTYNPPILHDRENDEQYVEYVDEMGRQHVARYPSVETLRKRLSLCPATMIWEAGQGLDEFWSVLQA